MKTHRWNTVRPAIAGLLIMGLSFPSFSEAAPPSSPAAGSAWVEPSTGMEFVWVEGGCYKMGCDQTWAGKCDKKNQPAHEVCVDGFWIGKYEVTQGQWVALMGSNPSEFGDCGDQCAVERVSWMDVQEYSAAFSEKAGIPSRLPTEAEWEYAARSGGKTEKYAGFSQESEMLKYGNFCDTNCPLDWKTPAQDDGYAGTSPVGSFQANGLGIHDMTGNVWEWCLDVFGEEFYGTSPRENPRGPEEGKYHALRGGGWNSFPDNARTVKRDRRATDNRRDNLGFRLVLPAGQS